jgi:Animal haem peroxidase
MRPFRESSQDHYSRLFPPAPVPTDVDRYCEAVTALGEAMIDDGARVSDHNPEILLDAGYTYFGQLLSHDLTKDVSSIDEAWQKEPEQLQNLQTPKLDLHVLYGGGPDGSPELYEDDGVRLKLGEPNATRISFDICVAKNGERVLADDRGAENMVLRQMTAVFARLHNFAVKQFGPVLSCRHSLFAKAQRQTRRQFQYLVVHDYLQSVLDKQMYKRIFAEGKTDIEWSSFSIPIEFSAAAMRFGHAMVRPNYLFSFGKEIFLQELLGRTTDRGPLRKDEEISWGFFFQGAGPENTVTSRPIDTRLAPPFQDLPGNLIGTPEAKCPFARTAGHPSQLAVRTLLRGAGLRLPSGQTAARACNQEPLTEQELTTNSVGDEIEQGRILREAGLTSETPLWYYILKESEVRRNGNRLGPVGSYIVGETIHAALRTDAESILSQPDDCPPIWQLPDGSSRIYGFSELFRLAKLL